MPTDQDLPNPVALEAWLTLLLFTNSILNFNFDERLVVAQSSLNIDLYSIRHI